MLFEVAALRQALGLSKRRDAAAEAPEARALQCRVAEVTASDTTLMMSSAEERVGESSAAAMKLRGSWC